MRFQFLPHFDRHFQPVVAILVRQDDLFQPGTGRGQNLFLDAADAQNAARAS